MGKYNPNENGSKRDYVVNSKSENDKLKTDFAKKGENQDRNQPSKPSVWQKDEGSKSQYNTRTTVKSQPQSEERDTRKQSGVDEQRPRSGK